MFKQIFCLFVFAFFSVFSNSPAATLKYQQPITLSTGAITPNSFAVGDFNSDGKPDLAVPDQYGKTVSVYLNDGSGHFGNPIVTTLAIDNTLGSILAGDLNEDGKTDLVVATVAGTQYAIVLLGQGDGTFNVQPPIAGSFGFQSGKIADFNADGHVDLFFGGNGEPYLFTGKGDGTFTQQTIPNGSFPGDYPSVAIGDFNGDKHLDAILADYGDPTRALGSVDFFPGNGSGSFNTPAFYQPPAINNPGSLDTADFDHDGKLDLVIGSNSAVFLARGNGDGTFQTDSSQLVVLYGQLVNEAVSNPDFTTAVVADLDQDGKPDVVIQDATTGELSLVLNDGTGTFSDALNTPYIYQLPTNSYYVATADLNGDGLPDIVVSNQTAKTMTILLSAKVLSQPTLNLVSSGNAVLVGTPLTFTAQVSGAGATPTGSVELLDGGTQISQQTLDASGKADFNISSLSTGTHSLTLQYSGDGNFMAAASQAISQSITDFQVAITPATQTVASGSSTSYTLTVAPQAGFTGSVALSCSGLPELASCNASSINVNAGTATATVTIKTVGTTTSALFSQSQNLIYACALFGYISLWTIAKRSKKTYHSLLLVAPFGLFILISTAIGCGGGGAKKATTPGTPSGTSTFTITATATQNGVSVKHSATSTLIVQ